MLRTLFNTLLVVFITSLSQAQEIKVYQAPDKNSETYIDGNAIKREANNEQTGSYPEAVAAPSTHPISPKEIPNAKIWTEKPGANRIKTSPINLIEPYEFTLINNKAIRSIAEYYYQIDTLTQDTSVNYGDGWIELIYLDTNGFYKELYIIYPNEANTKDSPRISTKYYYKDGKFDYKDHYSFYSGEVESKKWYVYDPYSKVIQHFLVSYHSSGKLDYEQKNVKQRFLYPDSKTVVEESYENEQGRSTYYHHRTKIYTYNKDGQILSYKSIDPKNELLINTGKYTYKNGNRIKEIYQYNNSTSTYQYTYNEKGDVIQATSTLDNRKTVSYYQYIYDEYGYWIQCIVRKETFMPNKETMVEVSMRKRFIEYY